MTWVKICGLTSADDVRVAAALGADAVGLVLAPSKRQITLGQAAALAEAAPAGVLTVAVVTAIDLALARGIRQAGIGAVQLHGETPGDGVLAELAELRVLQAVPVRAAADLDRPEPPWLWAWVLDSPPAEHAGGSGQAFDWSLAAGAAKTWRRPVILAGGLTPGNVEQAIDQVKPWGVDVSTGVESAPGRKDERKLAAFMAAVRRSEG